MYFTTRQEYALFEQSKQLYLTNNNKYGIISSEFRSSFIYIEREVLKNMVYSNTTVIHVPSESYASIWLGGEKAMTGQSNCRFPLG